MGTLPCVHILEVILTNHTRRENSDEMDFARTRLLCLIPWNIVAIYYMLTLVLGFVNTGARTIEDFTAVEQQTWEGTY